MQAARHRHLRNAGASRTDPVNADVQWCGLTSGRSIGARFVEVDARMMRGGIGIVNEMEF
jgi:hypothetical protein